MVDSSAWLESQNAAIGCVLVDPSLAAELLSNTDKSDFSGAALAAYEVISKIFAGGQNPDPVLVAARLGPEYRDYLSQLVELTPSTAMLGQYITLVKERSRMARLRELLSEGAMADNLQDMQTAIQKANEICVQNGRETASSMAELAMRFYDRVKNGEQYILTGIPELDGRVHLRPGGMNVIGAAPGRGKTALALQIACNQAKTYRVGYYTLEADRDQLYERLLASASSVDMTALTNKQTLTEFDFARIASANKELTRRGLWVQHAHGWTVDEIFHHAVANRYSVIVIDYLQIVRSTLKDRTQAVADISMRIHTLAQRNKILVHALSQVSREFRSDKKSEEIGMSDLRESGQIEQDADSIMLLYLASKGDFNGHRQLKIAKNKQGRTGQLELNWYGATQRFEPIPTKSTPPVPNVYKPPPDSTPVPFEQMEIKTKGTKCNEDKSNQRHEQ